MPARARMRTHASLQSYTHTHSEQTTAMPKQRGLQAPIQAHPNAECEAEREGERESAHARASTRPRPTAIPPQRLIAHTHTRARARTHTHLQLTGGAIVMSQSSGTVTLTGNSTIARTTAVRATHACAHAPPRTHEYPPSYTYVHRDVRCVHAVCIPSWRTCGAHTYAHAAIVGAQACAVGRCAREM
jgi:hypothetical protein